ncbi:MAG: nucleotidyltransferase domain-containing protein [Chloroflexi bacterium]|nr:nucleotidyltransferase domain-containing protein [Chloroflexota bacterium]
MNLISVSQVLQTHKADLVQFAVKSIAIFGSAAREEAIERSDIDLLVEFNRPIGLFEFICIKYYCEAEYRAACSARGVWGPVGS